MHNILISKLSSLGISAQPLDWITDFLCNRTQTVIYSDLVSTLSASFRESLHEGSVLGSLLFVDIIDDLPEQALHCNVILFADDFKAIGDAADSNEQGLVQQDLNSIGSWSEAHYLPLSIDKCMSIHFGLQYKKRSNSINGTTIKDTEQCADLGVNRTSNFHYKVHVNDLCLRAARLSGIVARLLSTRSREFLMKVFLMYICPSLEYASIICNPREIGATMQLEQVQRRFLTRRFFGWSAPTYEDRMALLGVPSLCTRRKTTDMAFIQKLLHNLVDFNSESIGIRLCEGNTRGSGVNLALRRAPTELIKNIFCFRVKR